MVMLATLGKILFLDIVNPFSEPKRCVLVRHPE